MTQSLEDLKAIEACVQQYIDGANTGDGDLLRSAFHETAHMYGNYDAQEYAVPIGRFIDHAEKSDPPSKTGEDHRAAIQSVDFDGTAGVVKVVEENYQGADFTDYFFVMRFADGWKIVTKLFNKG